MLNNKHEEAIAQLVAGAMVDGAKASGMPARVFTRAVQVLQATLDSDPAKVRELLAQSPAGDAMPEWLQKWTEERMGQEEQEQTHDLLGSLPRNFRI